MYNNEQTFIISVCILQSHLFTVSQAQALFSLKKLFRDGGARFVIPFTTLMHLAMFTDCPSGIWQMRRMGLQVEALTMPLGLSSEMA